MNAINYNFLTEHRHQLMNYFKHTNKKANSIVSDMFELEMALGGRFSNSLRS